MCVDGKHHLLHVPSSSKTATASAISSVACGPRICTPESRHTWRRRRPSRKPSWLPTIVAFELPRRGICHLHFVPLLFRLGLGQAHRPNLRLGVRATGNAVAPHRRNFLPAILAAATIPLIAPTWASCGSPATMSPMAKTPGSAVSLRAVHLHKPALQLDLRLLHADVPGSRRTPTATQNLFSFFNLDTAVRVGEGHLHAARGLLHLLHPCAVFTSMPRFL